MNTESLEKIEEQKTETLKPEIEKRQLPVGIGGTELKQYRETLPAVEVDNKTIWVNSNIEMPFDITRGQFSKLGIFLTLEADGQPAYPLEIESRHKRSGIVGRVIFKDKEGRIYRDVDIKGVGYIEDDPGGEYPFIVRAVKNQRGQITMGILNRDFAENDIDIAEKFLKYGVRTYRPLALIELKEIIDDNGKKISIDEARKRHIIKYRDRPVVELRAWGTRSRIADFSDVDKENNSKLINDAMIIVAQEIGIDPKEFSKDNYIEWFIKTMAKNVARIHARKMIHGYLTDHNITLDARIVDLDSVETVKEIKEDKRWNKKNFETDIERIKLTLSILTNFDRWEDVFLDAYEGELKQLQNK